MITGAQPMQTGSIKTAPELAAVQSLMPMEQKDRERLKADIERHGVKDPLRGYYKGQVFCILSGLNRLQIAKELGIKLVPVQVVEVKPKDREAYAIQENLARRQLSTAQKGALIDHLLKKKAGASSRSIARAAGVHHSTVESKRQVANLATCEQTRQGVDGKTYTKKESVHKVRKPPIRKEDALEEAFRQGLLRYGQGLTKKELEAVFKAALKQLYQ